MMMTRSPFAKIASVVFAGDLLRGEARELKHVNREIGRDARAQAHDGAA